MRRFVLTAVSLVGAGVLLAARQSPLFQQDQSRFTVPAGFAVEEVLSHEQVGSVAAITFDSRGQMVIAKEFGDIVTLIAGPDGTYEQRVFSDQITNSQGLVFDGPDLIAVAIGPGGTGMYRLIDENGDSRADRIVDEEPVNRRIEDHGPHAPVWGPDGYLYWINANTAGIYGDPSPLSPVRSYHDATVASTSRGFYRNPAGKVYRKNLTRHAGTAAGGAADPKDWELYSAGHRNPYDMAFNLIGEPFTFDSDHEPELAMPWYRGTSTVHILPGGEYGYREGSGVHPFYYFDNAPILEQQNRGSPTGVAVYHAYNYPAEYWDMVLFADWSRGRVIGTRLTRNGAGYTPQSGNFIFGTPLNVTDIEVGPDGNVYFTLGGRWTQGGVYRVVYRGQEAMTRPSATTPIDQVLTMIQPRSAQSRELARATRARMGDRAWERALEAEVRNVRATPERRVRAMELLQVFGPELDDSKLVALRGDAAWEVRAASTYYLGLRTTETARRELVARLKDGDAFVQRRAAEALLRTGVHPTAQAPIDPEVDVFPLLASEDPYLRHAARNLLREINPNRWRESVLALNRYPEAVEGLLAYVQTVGPHQDMYNFSRIINREYELLRADPTEEQLLDLLRLMQVTMARDQGVRSFPLFPSSARVTGGVIYRPGQGFFNSDEVRPDGTGGGTGQSQNVQVYAEIGQALLARFPASDWRVNRELTRVLAHIQAPGTIDKVLPELTNISNDAKQQIHYVDMLSRFETGWDDASVERMTVWFEQAARDRMNVTAMRTAYLARIPGSRAEAVMARIQAAQPQTATLPAGPGGFGGGAPGGPMTEEQIESLIFNPQATLGNASAGMRAYERAACIACHTFGPTGIQFGPDLSTIAQRFNRNDLVRSIVYPSEAIADQFQGVTVTRTDGQTVTGILLQENSENLILQMAGGAEVIIPIAQVRSRARPQESLMPHGLLDGLTNQERYDLLALLIAGPAAIPDTTLARLQRR
jgi:putative heme-binding domain-containing protein